MRRGRLALGFAALLLLGSAVVLWRATTRSRAATASRSFRYEIGIERTYRIELDEDARAHVASGGPDAGLGARTRLRGVLALAAVASRPRGGALVRVSLPELEEASILVGERDVLGERRAELDRAFAEVEIGARGELGPVRFSASTSELVRNVLMLALTESAVSLGDGDVWSAEERTLQGSVVSAYQAHDAGTDLVLERVRSRYTDLVAAHAGGRAVTHELDSHATATIDRTMFVRELSTHEVLHVTGAGPRLDDERTFHATYLASRTLRSAGPVSTTSAVLPGALAVTGALERNLLLDRVDGLDAETMLHVLDDHVASGALPDENRFLWRASGLLRLDPSRAHALVELALRDGMTSDGRALLLDLLVGAGTAESQAAMIEILRGLPAGERAVALLYQRIGLVSSPGDALVAFARERLDAPGAEGRGAARVAFGAVVGHRLARHEPSAAADLETLRTLAREGQDPAEIAELVEALGNTRAAGLDAELRGFAAATDPGVRRAAAFALRSATSAEARASLLQLASDRDVDVQRRALTTLAGRPVAATEVTALTELVRKGRIAEASFELVLDVVARRITTDRATLSAEDRELLVAIRASGVQSRGVLARARELLENN